jgi:hypothetical protein
MSEENEEFITAEEAVQIWLNPYQAKALREYCTAENVSEDDKRTLALLLGRGYRPPTTVAGWREIHQTIVRITKEVDNER